MKTFGYTLRAHRLGWHLAPRHNAFVRMSDAGDGRNCIEVATITDGVERALTCDTRTGPKSGRQHRCWWEAADPEALLDMVAPLRTYLLANAPTGYAAFVVDDDGQEVARG